MKKPIRKRKLAELNGLAYKKAGFEYKGIEGFEDAYELTIKGSKGIGAVVRKPYTENFLKGLELMKEVSAQHSGESL